jgi:hypothetical protein
MATKVLGTFSLPGGLSSTQLNTIIESISKSGVYDELTNSIIFKNETGEDLFSVDLSAAGKNYTGGTSSTGTVSIDPESNVITITVNSEAVIATEKGKASGIASLDENSLVQETAKKAQDYDTTGTIKTKFDNIDSNIGNIQNKLDGLTGATIYLGKIDEVNPNQGQLTQKAQELLGEGKQLIAGHTIIDGDGNEWNYNGTQWVDLGTSYIGTATNTEFGIVKGGTDVSINGGEMTVLHATNADQLGGVAANQYALKSELTGANTVWQVDVTGEATDASKLVELTDAKKGDIAVLVRTDIGNPVISYILKENGPTTAANWVALCGKVTTENVVLGYTLKTMGNGKIGGIPENTTFQPNTTLKTILNQMFVKIIQPTITQPSISISASGTKSVEAGTQVNITVTPTFNPGKYTYGPATGVTLQTYTLQQNLKGSTTTIVDAASTAEPHTVQNITIEDGVTIQFNASCTHTAGAQPLDNSGAPATVQGIQAGTKSVSNQQAFSGFRKYFYGCKTTITETVDSAYIRGLTGSSGAYNNNSWNINVPEGTKEITIAVEDGKTLRNILYVEGMNTDVLSTFTMTKVPVEGANGFTAKNYNVYRVEVPGGLTARTYKVNG